MGRGGYGKAKIKYVTISTHRAAWRIARFAIPEGMCVLHHCDNRLCCNPNHLFLGTHSDNSRDMVAKGRQASGDRNGGRLHPESRARGDRNGTRTHPEKLHRGDDHHSRRHPERLARGETHSKAKLTTDNVSDIRSEYAAGGISQRALAKKYNVSQGAIGRIVLGKHWKHVPYPEITGQPEAS